MRQQSDDKQPGKLSLAQSQKSYLLQSIYKNSKLFLRFLRGLPIATLRLINFIPSNQTLYKPLDNNEIVLSFTEAQSKWWTKEPARMQAQQKIKSFLQRLSENQKQKGKVAKQIKDLKISIPKQKLQSNAEFVQCNQRLAELDIEYKGLLNEYKNGSKRNAYAWFLRAKSGEFMLDLTLGAFVETYVEEPEFLAVSPNTTLFWNACDIKDASEYLQTNPFGQCYSHLLSDQIDKGGGIKGESTARAIANAFKVETLRELTDSVDGKPLKTIWNVASWLMAHEASGTVFMINSDNDLRDGSTWQYIELPELMKNKDVDMIVNIDVMDPGRVKGIYFPNGLKLVNTHECTFEMPRDVGEMICDDSQKKKFLDIHSGKKVTCKSLYENGITSFSNKPFMVRNGMFKELDEQTGLETKCDNFDNVKDKIINSYSIKELIGNGRRDVDLNDKLRQEFLQKIEGNKHDYMDKGVE